METAPEQKPKQIFVEIGTNGLAVPFIGERQFGDGQFYVGIDINREMLEQSKESVEYTDRSTSHIMFVQANGEQIPIADRSAHEVFLGNVLGDPHISHESKDRFLAEARRIVTDDGEVIIKENNTPAELAMVQPLLKKHGLVVKKYIDSYMPGWQEFIQQYHRTFANAPFSIADYVIIAVPK